MKQAIGTLALLVGALICISMIAQVGNSPSPQLVIGILVLVLVIVGKAGG